MPAPEYNVNNLAPLFDEFGNNLSDAADCPTIEENRAARYERENAIRAAHEARQRAAMADDTLVQIAPVADNGLGAEFESEPFRNAAIRDAEWDAQSREWERDRVREEDRAA